MATSFEPTIRRTQPSRSVEASIKRGKKFLAEKRPDEAMQEFESIVEQGNATPFVHSALGRIKYRQKDLDGALHHFKEAIQLDPTQAPTYIRAARTYFSLGDLSSAKEALENAIKVNPKATLAYAGLGQLAMHEKQYALAVEHFNTALRMNPRLVIARKRVAIALTELGKTADAKARLNAALRVKADDAEVHAIFGKVHLFEKDYAAAQDSYGNAIELSDKDNPVVHMGLAEALIEGDQLVRAEKVLSDMPVREQLSALMHKLWGDLYYRKGMNKEAVEEYRAATLAKNETVDVDDDLALLDIATEDSDDHDWESLAQSFSAATASFVQKRRHSD